MTVAVIILSCIVVALAAAVSWLLCFAEQAKRVERLHVNRIESLERRIGNMERGEWMDEEASVQTLRPPGRSG